MPNGNDITKEYPGDSRYLVYADGTIVGQRGWILKPGSTTGGYLTVNIAGKTKKVAHIVAETWLGKRPDGYQVAHLDGNNQNNNVSNLKYVTRSENERHKVNHGTSNHGERNGRAKLTEKQIEQIKKLLKDKIRQIDIAARFGISQGHVSAINRGANW